jgi:carbonic anhydrase
VRPPCRKFPFRFPSGEPYTLVQFHSIVSVRLAYYGYHGSLTTPPCSKTVEWLLLTDPIQVADADIAGFAKLYAMNARPAQKANRRDVLRSG